MVFPFLDVSGIHNDPLDTLSPRERELLAELGSGRTNAELARNLGVSVNTVKFHLRNLFDKLQVEPRPGRAALARKPANDPLVHRTAGHPGHRRRLRCRQDHAHRGHRRDPGADRVACICSDDYHRYGRAERAALGLTALDPAANHLDIFEQHLRLLRQGQPILKPVYDHRDGSLAAPQYVVPRPYIIVEGLLGYHSRAMRDCYDVKLFLEPAEELRVRWKTRATRPSAATAARRSCARSPSASPTPRPSSGRSGPSPTSSSPSTRPAGHAEEKRGRT